MRSSIFLDESELPPKPAPETGEPRPPHAPFHQDFAKKSEEQLRRERVTDPAKAPAPPEGHGPLLAWYRASWKEALKTAAWVVPFFPVALSLYRFSLDWIGFWQAWIFLPLIMLGVYSTQRTVVVAAGAEWLKHGKSWVRLYELTDIEVKHRGNDMHLDLTDDAGRTIMSKLIDLQKDQHLWDLIYNGILHSVIAGGATTTGMVHSALEVPRRPGSVP